MKNPDAIWIVIVLVIVILVGSNLVMFGMVRAFRNTKFTWFKDMSKPLDQSWGKEEKDFNELAQKVQEIKRKNQSEDED